CTRTKACLNSALNLMHSRTTATIISPKIKSLVVLRLEPERQKRQNFGKNEASCHKWRQKLE
ncbi:MAG: hypothetical protein AAFY09_15085, partial [Pseudomonadota bacterium]